MTLDEKIEESIERHLVRATELLQDAPDDVSELLKLLRALHDSLPLLRDIKTEVADIQKQVHQKNSDEEEEKQEDNSEPQRREPPDPETMQELHEILQEIEKTREYLEYLPKYPGLPQPGLPIPTPEGGPIVSAPTFKMPSMRTPTWSEVIGLALKLKKLLDRYNDRVQGALNSKLQNSDAKNKGFWQQLWDDVKTDFRIMGETLEDVEQTLSDGISQCCTNMNDSLSQLRETVGSEIGPSLDNVEFMISQLQPTAQSNNTLAVVSKTSAILAELQGIRGLL